MAEYDTDKMNMSEARSADEKRQTADTARIAAAKAWLQNRAEVNFENGRVLGDPEFERNVSALFELMPHLWSKWRNKWPDKDMFEMGYTNAMFPPPPKKEKNEAPVKYVFQKYRHEKNPGKDFYKWFMREVKYKLKDLLREEEKVHARTLQAENLDDKISEMYGQRNRSRRQQTKGQTSYAEQPDATDSDETAMEQMKRFLSDLDDEESEREELNQENRNKYLTKGAQKKDDRYSGVTEEADMIVESYLGDMLYFDLASHIISMRKRIASGVNEEKRIANDQMFHTRMIVHDTRKHGAGWEHRHARQIYLSLDGPLLRYTYREMPKDMNDVQYHVLKRNIDINPETTKSDAHEELKTPYVYWVLARYLHEIQGRKLMRESAINNREEGYKKRMEYFLQTKGIKR